MNRLKKLGFKKIPGTEPGFHMYELTPAKLQSFDENFRAQASKRTSSQAHKLDKIKWIWDIVGYKQKEKYGKHDKINSRNE